MLFILDASRPTAHAIAELATAGSQRSRLYLQFQGIASSKFVDAARSAKSCTYAPVLQTKPVSTSSAFGQGSIGNNVSTRQLEPAPQTMLETVFLCTCRSSKCRQFFQLAKPATVVPPDQCAIVSLTGLRLAADGNCRRLSSVVQTSLFVLGIASRRSQILFQKSKVK
jgi:hypothetical protein